MSSAASSDYDHANHPNNYSSSSNAAGHVGNISSSPTTTTNYYQRSSSSTTATANWGTTYNNNTRGPSGHQSGRMYSMSSGGGGGGGSGGGGSLASILGGAGIPPVVIPNNNNSAPWLRPSYSTELDEADWRAPTNTNTATATKRTMMSPGDPTFSGSGFGDSAELLRPHYHPHPSSGGSGSGTAYNEGGNGGGVFSHWLPNTFEQAVPAEHQQDDVSKRLWSIRTALRAFRRFDCPDKLQRHTPVFNCTASFPEHFSHRGNVQVGNEVLSINTNRRQQQQQQFGNDSGGFMRKPPPIMDRVVPSNYAGSTAAATAAAATIACSPLSQSALTPQPTFGGIPLSPRDCNNVVTPSSSSEYHQQYSMENWEAMGRRMSQLLLVQQKQGIATSKALDRACETTPLGPTDVAAAELVRLLRDQQEHSRQRKEVMTVARTTSISQETAQYLRRELLAPSVGGLSFSTLDDPVWCYKDPSGRTQGPFSSRCMMAWWKLDYFPSNLPVRFSQKMPTVKLSDVYPEAIRDPAICASIGTSPLIPFEAFPVYVPVTGDIYFPEILGTLSVKELKQLLNRHTQYFTVPSPSPPVEESCSLFKQAQSQTQPTQPSDGTVNRQEQQQQQPENYIPSTSTTTEPTQNTRAAAAGPAGAISALITSNQSNPPNQQPLTARPPRASKWVASGTVGIEHHPDPREGGVMTPPNRIIEDYSRESSAATSNPNVSVGGQQSPISAAQAPPSAATPIIVVPTMREIIQEEEAKAKQPSASNNNNNYNNDNGSMNKNTSGQPVATRWSQKLRQGLNLSNSNNTGIAGATTTTTTTNSAPKQGTSTGRKPSVDNNGHASGGKGASMSRPDVSSGSATAGPTTTTGTNKDVIPAKVSSEQVNGARNLAKLYGFKPLKVEILDALYGQSSVEIETYIQNASSTFTEEETAEGTAVMMSGDNLIPTRGEKLCRFAEALACILEPPFEEVRSRAGSSGASLIGHSSKKHHK